MDKAKAAVNDFMAKSGHHDTTVHETVAPAVKKEIIKPHRHEEIHTAVDKEIHQDHYHHTVQPVHDREVLPEQHTTQLGAVQHREIDHRNHDATKRNLAGVQAAFKDQRVVDDTTHSKSARAAIGGEHIHHHIHETIQPVVHKEIIQPHVVHTTVPIHEVHHNAATHHETSELPAMTMSEFKSKGGVLGGRGERYDGFEGEPKHIGGTLQHMMEGKHSKRDSGHAESDKLSHNTQHGDLNALNGGKHNTSTGLSNKTHSHEHGQHHDRTHTGAFATSGTAATAGTAAVTSKHADSNHSSLHQTNSHASSGVGLEKRPSLLDRINPLKDADGDGKKGFMT